MEFLNDVLNFIFNKPNRYIVRDDNDGGISMTFSEDELLKLLKIVPAPNRNYLIWFNGEWQPLKYVRKTVQGD